MNKVIVHLLFAFIVLLTQCCYAQSIIADWDTFDKKNTQPPKALPAPELPTINAPKPVILEDNGKSDLPKSDVKLSDVLPGGDKKLTHDEEKKALIKKFTTREPYDYRNKKWPDLYLKKTDEANKHLPQIMYQKDYSVLLYDAISQNNISAIDMLLSKGADINAALARLSMTPLIFAVINNQNVAAEYLILRGADINKTDAVGRTAIHYAAHNNNIKVFELLQKYGADPYQKDQEGKSAYDYLPADIRDKIVLSKLSTQHDLDEAILKMSLEGNLRAVSYLVGRGANVNTLDKNYNSVLINAVKSRNSKLIAYLLENGANPLQCNMMRKDAYIIAYENGQYDDAKLIDTFIIKIELETGIKHKRIYTYTPQQNDEPIPAKTEIREIKSHKSEEVEYEPTPETSSKGMFDDWFSKENTVVNEPIHEDKLEKLNDSKVTEPIVPTTVETEVPQRVETPSKIVEEDSSTLHSRPSAPRNIIPGRMR